MWVKVTVTILDKTMCDFSTNRVRDDEKAVFMFLDPSRK